MSRGKSIIMFNGMNYAEWHEDATVKLLDRNLIEACVNAGFLFWKANQQAPSMQTRQSSTQVDEEKEKSEKIRLNEIDRSAKFRLLESIPSELRKPSWILPSTSAHDVWSEMETTYGALTIAALTSYRSQLQEIKWRAHEELPKLINQLDKLKQLTSTSKEGKINDIELIMQITRHYPKEWESKIVPLRDNSAVMNNWESLKSSLMNEFLLRNSLNSPRQSVQAKAYQTKNKPKKFCTNCQEKSRKKAMRSHNIEECFLQGGGAYKREKDANQKGKIKVGQIGFSKKNQIVIDTGATHHITNDQTWLYKTYETQFAIELPNGDVIGATKCGSLDLELENGKVGTFENVYYCAQFTGTLISFQQMEQKGCKLMSGNKTLDIVHKDEIILSGKLNDGLYVADVTPRLKAKAGFNRTAPNTTISMLHKRMGHANEDALKKVPANTEGVKFNGTLPNSCEVCAIAKSQNLPSHSQNSRVEQNGLGRLDFDVSGPHPEVSTRGFRYYLVAILTKSNYLFAIPLVSKDHAANEMIKILNWIQNQLKEWPTGLRSDNAREFLSLKSFAEQNGIEYTTSSAYTHNQNAKAERSIKTLNYTASALLMEGCLEGKFWCFAIEHAAYIRNRTPSKVLGWITPFEALRSVKPSLKYIRRFGCFCFILLKPAEQRKIGQKSQRGIYLGNTPTGYIVLLEDNSVTYSRNVTFNEDLPAPSSQMRNPFLHMNEINDSSVEEVSSDESEDEHSFPPTSPNLLSHLNRVSYAESPISPTYSTDDYVPSENPISPSTDDEGTRNSTEMATTAMLGSVQSNKLPHKLDDPSLSSEWNESIHNEWTNLIDTGCLTPVAQIPATCKPITVKPVFTVKTDDNGSIIKYKTRIVARGFLQRPGVDFTETYAGVAASTSIRVLLALKACLGGELCQYDIKHAFLNGDIKEDVFVKLTSDQGTSLWRSFPRLQGVLTYKVRKGLYGLKQAGHQWQQKLSECLTKANLNQSKLDPCVYYSCSGEYVEYIATHVDDIVSLRICGKSTWVELLNESNITVNRVDNNNKFLGVFIGEDELSVNINQTNYLIEKIAEFRMEMASGIGAPNIENLEKAETMDAKLPFLELLGSMQYAASQTRPDLSYYLSYLAKFSQCYQKSHFKSAKSVLRYIIQTKDISINYVKQNQKGEPVEIIGYADADFASSNDNDDKRRSVTGYFILVAGGPVSWKSQRQKAVCTSTCEAETNAATHAAREMIFISALLNEIGVKVKLPMVLKLDNQSSITVLNSAGNTTKSKHFDVLHFKIKEYIEEKLIKLEYVKSDDNVADMLTKALGARKLKTLLNKLNMN